MAYSESINRLGTVRERIMRARVCGIYEKLLLLLLLLFLFLILYCHDGPWPIRHTNGIEERKRKIIRKGRRE